MKKITRRKYPTDLSDSQSQLILKFLKENHISVRRTDILEIFNAICYICKTGCQWQMLPHEFPKWQTVYYYYRSWIQRGWLENLLFILVCKTRRNRGKNDTPSVGVIDSCSIKSALPQSEKGIDGNKRIKGIKLHLITDSNGYPLGVDTTCANIHDARSADELITNTRAYYKTVKVIKADLGYRGLRYSRIAKAYNIEVRCVKSNYGTSTFRPIDGRWVVERTFAWLDRYRRMARNYEQKLYTARGTILLCCISFLLRYF